MKRHPPAARWRPSLPVRALLALYPAEFRETYGHEIALAARDAWHDARTGLDRARLVWSFLRTLAVEVAREHAGVARWDVRDGWRSIRRAPTVSVVIVLTFALSIGVNAVMLDAIDRLLVRAPRGVSDPQRVVRVYGADTWTALTRSWPDYLDLKTRAATLAGVAAYRTDREPVAIAGRLERLKVDGVTAGYFGTLGVSLSSGAVDESNWLAGTPVAVVSSQVARQIGHGGDVVGRTLIVGANTLTVVGVTREFEGVDADATGVWTPLGNQPYDRGAYGAVHVVARLRPGVSVAAASADAGAANLLGWAADGLPQGAALMQLGPLPRAQGPDAPPELRVVFWLGATALLVFASGCANIVLLLLLRASTRRSEAQIRVALGASAHRLRRRWWTETMMLCLSGGLVTTALIAWGAPVLHRVFLGELVGRAWSMDGRLLGGIAILTGLAGFICTLWPAQVFSRTSGPVGTPSRSIVGAGPAPSVLVVAQVAVAVVLVAGTGLFVRSLSAATALDAGFDMDRTVVIRVESAGRALDDAGRADLLRQLIEPARNQTGGGQVGLTHTVPFESAWRTRFYIRGRDPERWGDQGGGRFNFLSTVLSAGALAALEVPLLDGRRLGEGDTATSEPVAVVNRALARAVWGTRSPVGECMHLMEPSAPCTRVVGLVGDTRVEQYFDVAPPQYYLSLAQARRGERATAIVARVASPGAGAAAMERALGRVVPSGTVALAYPVASLVEPVLKPWRMGTAVFALFGSLALAVAMIGLFALLSAVVARRMPELAVCRALGAQGRHVVAAVTAPIVRTVVPGLAAGVLLSLAIRQALAPLLYAIEPTDSVALAGAALVCVVACAAAAVIPLVRALRIQPLDGVKYPE